MRCIKKETDLFRPISGHIRRKTFRRQEPELQFYDYSIDLYGYSSQKDLTIAVELKLYRWKRALEQALIYRLCSDLVYIAMPGGIAKRIDQELLCECGIGLFAVSDSGRCYEIIPAEQSSIVRQLYRNDHIQMLEKGRQRCPL